MNPIFNEYLTFLRDTSGESLPDLHEGYFWLDRQIIKGFDKQGNLHKFYRINVSDSLELSIDKPKSGYENVEDIDVASWSEIVDMNKSHLENIENESMNIVRDTLMQYDDYDFYALTSTGKDSSVVLYIVEKVLPSIKVMFNNTSLDCSDTYKMVKTHPNWIVTNPKEGFYQWIKRMNYIPNRFSRGCCGLYKEGASIEYFENIGLDKLILFMGVRREESASRQTREIINHNPKWGSKEWYSCMPVLNWTELDVWLYMLWRDIEINPKYKKGYTRVGCAIACPYYTKSTWVLDKYWYPNMYKRWHEILHNDFVNNQRWQQLNCTEKEYHTCWNGGLLRSEPTEEVIKELMEYKGIEDESVAKQYFNKKCENDGKNVRQKDTIAMNMKYRGRNIDKFYCKKCLMKLLNMNETDWQSEIARFKEQGCSLF